MSTQFKVCTYLGKNVFATSECLGVAVGSKMLKIGIVAIICNQKMQDYLNSTSIHF